MCRIRITGRFQLCEDCAQAAVNDDYSGLDYYLGPQQAEEKKEQIETGLERLGPISPTGMKREMSIHPCDCCLTMLHGERHEFLAFVAVPVEDNEVRTGKW